MPTVRIKIEPSVLKWVIQKARRETASDAVFKKLNEWLAGEKEPTFNQVEDMSKKTHIPFGYFFLKQPPEEHYEIIDYRTINGSGVQDPSRNLIDTLDAMYRAQDWMSDYLRDMGFEKLSFVGDLKTTVNINHAALYVRDLLGLDTAWYSKVKNTVQAFSFLRNRIASLCVLVMQNGIVGDNTHRKLDVNEFRAFTLVDSYAPLIFINTCDTAAGKVFSLLHEFVHVCLGRDSLYNAINESSNIVNKDEQFCNAIAAEILAPREEFIKEWVKCSGSTHSRIDAMISIFCCSRFVVSRKALDLGFINQTEYEQLIGEYLGLFTEYKRSGSGGNYYNTQNTRWDRRFITALNLSALSGRTAYSEIYRLTKMKSNTFAELVERERVW